MKTKVTAIVASLCLTSALQASEFEPAMQAYLNNDVTNWVLSPTIVEAINRQNIVTNAYSQSMIDEADSAWRAEVGAMDTPTITPVISNETADFLRRQVEISEGRITEIFLMDAHGLNVAASDVTSDFWQGDEDKFTETYGKGTGSVHFSEVEFDESTQRYQVQISLTIVHPTTNKPIGAITVGIDPEALM